MTMTPMDYEDIRQLQARYNLAVDFGERAAFEACFTQLVSDDTFNALPRAGWRRLAEALPLRG
ncbi:nuclear transport factor 2 family protein [Streptomyces sp. NPDC102274]|uniref:nuclear transport factor 2 family protein n=1 Tax=Streptomyces sp. NPDC102274 TaxID=3366151 RepID=UPI00382ECB19